MSDLHPLDEVEVLRAEVVRLNKVVKALMNRVEHEANTRPSSFGMFQDAVTLENQVRRRTAELEAALHENERINLDLTREREEQRVLIRKLEEAHRQLLQSEKLASIGQLAAGVAHEINNPIGFVNSNLGTLRRYVDDILGLLDEYACIEAEASAALRARIQAVKQRMDIPFLREDMTNLISESIEGTSRVSRIVQDLRDFSSPGDSTWQLVDLHSGLESTLNVARNEIKYKADVVRDYGDLPLVECLPSQLNQVFLNLFVNAAQAIAGRGVITIRTRHEGDWVTVSVHDSGCGITPDIRDRVFDPFFTTRTAGKGTGLGLSVAYGIVDKHGGHIEVESEPGKGSTFTVCLPVRRKPEHA